MGPLSHHGAEIKDEGVECIKMILLKYKGVISVVLNVKLLMMLLSFFTEGGGASENFNVGTKSQFQPLKCKMVDVSTVIYIIRLFVI